MSRLSGSVHQDHREDTEFLSLSVRACARSESLSGATPARRDQASPTERRRPVTAVVALLAALAGHWQGTAQILVVGLLVHGYPVMIQRTVRHESIGSGPARET